MNSANPTDKGSFRTPERNAYTAGNESNIRKTPPTAVDSRKQPSNTSPQTARFHQINVRIASKTNRPYLSPTASHSHSPQEYFHYQPSQLLQIIEMYEYQIAILRDYIHHSDLLERQRIVEIFGFEYPCTGGVAHQESKLVLRELSVKIKHLIRENNQLKSHYGSGSKGGQGTSKDYMETNLLVKENQKLRMLIDQLKNSESQDMSRLSTEVDRLRQENYILTQNIRKYQRKIQELQDNSRMNISSQIRQPYVPQVPPVQPVRQSNTSNTSNNNKQEIQFAKKQLTKQMFEFSQQLDQKYKQNESKIDQLQKRIGILEDRLKQFQKQRSLKIDSAIKKSFKLTQSILKLKGDLETSKDVIPEEDIIPKKEEGKIRTTNKFIHKKEEQREPAPEPVVDRNNEALNRSLKQVQQNLLMEQMKNKNILEQNNALKKRIKDMEKELTEKIQRIIKLQAIITGLERQKQTIKVPEKSTQNPGVQREVREIIETLKSCNVANFQLFFKEFNQILAQRKLLKETIESYQNASQAMAKSRRGTMTDQKQIRTALEQKVSELIDQNKRLLKKISDLQSQVTQYHQQLITAQIQKLNSIKFAEPMLPNGQQAIQWQLLVKKSIEVALARLYNLERKVLETQKTKNYSSVPDGGNGQRGSTGNLVRSLGWKHG